MGAGHCDLQRLHLLGRMTQQAVLEVDCGERRGKLAKVGRRRADETGKLAESPVGGRDRCFGARQDQRQPLGIVALCLDMDKYAFHDARAAVIERAWTAARRVSSDRKRSSAGRENHSEDTRPIRWPRETSTL